VDDWRKLSPFLTFTVIFVYLVLRYFLKKEAPPASKGPSKVNLAQQKDSDKVVTSCDIEDILKEKDGKKVFCRCWRSKTFPYCDGSHNKHNEITGDNVGPLIVSSGKKSK
jgi:CDGSH-type Zn-finger protein